MVSGVAGGLARRVGLPSSYVRAAFITLVFAGGIGAAVYLALWALTINAVSDDVETEPLPDHRRLAVGIMFLGVLLALRGFELWFGDGLVWPVALVAFGTAAVWDRREAKNGTTARDIIASPSRTRLLIGGAVLIAGLSRLFASVDVLAGLGPVVGAVIVTAVGFMLVFGHWVWNMASDLATERRDRIRSEERADMAAHLHDSVLQTLALIQRTDDARRMVTLARAQERELRSWLYGSGEGPAADSFTTALTAAAAKIEGDHDIPVEVVTVGDAAVDDDLNALIAAAGEAITNAAKHSGAGRISVYAELTDDAVDVWISDQGSGFDPAAVPTDRRGIADSIRGRVGRHRGSVEIVSSPAEGTEVHLTMPRVAP